MIQEEGKHYLYRHVRLDINEVFYIGIGTKHFKSKYKRSKSDYMRNKFWKNITNKTEWIAEILLESDDYNFIQQKEIEFIKLYGRRDLGKGTLTNLTEGGKGCVGYLHSDSSKHKMSLAKSKMSQETKQKIKEARAKQIFTEETSKLLSERVKARVKNGTHNFLKGKIGKDNHKSRAILQFSLSGEFIEEYESMNELYRLYKWKGYHIGNVAKGNKKTAYGYVWKFKD